jgi:hypothetical protein
MDATTEQITSMHASRLILADGSQPSLLERRLPRPAFHRMGQPHPTELDVVGLTNPDGLEEAVHLHGEVLLGDGPVGDAL